MALSLAESPATVYGDSARLVQVFGILVSNASKFTPQGGRIDVMARLEGAFAVVAVKDCGIGIAARKLVRIFEASMQLEHRETR